MATAALLCSDYLRCPVCLDLFREPVTIPCGHSFCLSCITRCWAPPAAPTTCPQCRCCFRSDSPPRLCKNSILAQMAEDFSTPQGSRDVASADTNMAKGIRESAESGHYTCTAEGELVRESIGTPTLCRRSIEPTSSSSSCDGPRREVIQGFADMVRILEASGFRVLQMMEQAQSRAQSQKLESEESQAGDEGLTMVAMPEGDQDQSVQVVPREAQDSQNRKKDEELPWDGLSAAVSEFKSCLKDLCGDHMGRMVQQVWTCQSTYSPLSPELWRSPLPPLIPRIRAEFLQYSREITLDPDTAHRNLSLLQGNHRVLCKLQPQNYPDYPGRFDHYTQVLGLEPLGQGRHYWEVQLCGNRISIGVSYNGIARKGHQSHCLAGRNSQSWCLEWSSNRCFAWHDGQKILVATGQQERLGVFLDWDGGCLSFHDVSESMPVLHRFQASFTQPVYPIFFVSWNSIVSIGEGPPSHHYLQNKRFHRQLSADF
ncbi:E3 ubiquitin-protein ligase TRIM47 [Discoglossus pictus]